MLLLVYVQVAKSKRQRQRVCSTEVELLAKYWPSIMLLHLGFLSLCIAHEFIAVNKDSNNCHSLQNSKTGKCINLHRIITAIRQLVFYFEILLILVRSICHFKQCMYLFVCISFFLTLTNASYRNAMMNIVIFAVTFNVDVNWQNTFFIPLSNQTPRHHQGCGRLFINFVFYCQ